MAVSLSINDPSCIKMTKMKTITLYRVEINYFESDDNDGPIIWCSDCYPLRSDAIHAALDNVEEILERMNNYSCEDEITKEQLEEWINGIFADEHPTDPSFDGHIAELTAHI